MRGIRKKKKRKASVSRSYPQRAPEGSQLSTKTSAERTNTPKQTLSCQMKSLCLPTHDSTQRCTHGAHSSPNNGFGMFVFHYNITRKGGERRNGKTRRRRGGGEERCSKSQEGGIYVDGGRNTPPNPYPPSFFFFLLQRGSRGPHNHGLIITSVECWECAGEWKKKILREGL